MPTLAQIIVTDGHLLVTAPAAIVTNHAQPFAFAQQKFAGLDPPALLLRL